MNSFFCKGGITDKAEQDRFLDSGNTSVFSQQVWTHLFLYYSLYSWNLIFLFKKIQQELKLSRQTLTDVEERNREIALLEENIRDLNQIFVDLAELVNEQGDIIDNIDANLTHTNTSVKEVSKVLPEAVDQKRAARRVRHNKINTCL